MAHAWRLKYRKIDRLLAFFMLFGGIIAKVGGKDFREVTSARIANQFRNLLHPHFRIGQQFLRPQQANLCQILYKGYAHLFMEKSAKIVRGNLQPLCDPGNADI